MKTYIKVCEHDHKLLLKKHSDILKDNNKLFHINEGEFFWIEDIILNNNIMKKYTIQDLREGKVALYNDDVNATIKVVKAAFPDNNPPLACNTYYSLSQDGWRAYAFPQSEYVQNASEFLQELEGITEKEENVRTFDTGSKRDSDAGKPRVADLKPYTRLRFGYHMLIGAEKYGEGNFELGQPDESTFKSLHRHLAKLEIGDMSEDHAGAIIFACQMIMLNQERADISTDHFYKQYTIEKANKDQKQQS